MHAIQPPPPYKAVEPTRLLEPLEHHPAPSRPTIPTSPPPSPHRPITLHHRPRPPTLPAYGGVTFELAIANLAHQRDAVSIETSVMHLHTMDMGPVKVSHVEHRPSANNSGSAVEQDADALIAEVETKGGGIIGGGGGGGGGVEASDAVHKVQETNLGRVIMMGDQWRTVPLRRTHGPVAKAEAILHRLAIEATGQDGDPGGTGSHDVAHRHEEGEGWTVRFKLSFSGVAAFSVHKRRHLIAELVERLGSRVVSEQVAVPTWRRLPPGEEGLALMATVPARVTAKEQGAKQQHQHQQRPTRAPNATSPSEVGNPASTSASTSTPASASALATEPADDDVTVIEVDETGEPTLEAGARVEFRLRWSTQWRDGRIKAMHRNGTCDIAHSDATDRHHGKRVVEEGVFVDVVRLGNRDQFHASNPRFHHHY